jgi:hypothetical protein
MSQRLCLFYAGFSAYAPRLYFSRLSFMSEYQPVGNETLRTGLEQISEALEYENYESASNIRTAMSLANHFELTALPEPGSPEDYFDWLQHYTESFEQQFPMSRIDYYYFYYSRKLAEILCNLGMADSFLTIILSGDNNLDLHKKVEKTFKDTEYIIFKLIAAAALLSSEPRQNYFNVHYKEMNAAFVKFKNPDISKMSGEEIQALISELKIFRNLVLEGFMKCLKLLKDLGR